MHFGHVEAVWFCGIVCGLPVDFWWSCGTWLVMCIPEAQDGGVVGVACTLPSGPASGPLRVLNEHFLL